MQVHIVIWCITYMYVKHYSMQQLKSLYWGQNCVYRETDRVILMHPFNFVCGGIIKVFWDTNNLFEKKSTVHDFSSISDPCQSLSASWDGLLSKVCENIPKFQRYFIEHVLLLFILHTVWDNIIIFLYRGL